MTYREKWSEFWSSLKSALTLDFCLCGWPRSLLFTVARVWRLFWASKSLGFAGRVRHCHVGQAVQLLPSTFLWSMTGPTRTYGHFFIGGDLQLTLILSLCFWGCRERWETTVDELVDKYHQYGCAFSVQESVFKSSLNWTSQLLLRV